MKLLDRSAFLLPTEWLMCFHVVYSCVQCYTVTSVSLIFDFMLAGCIDYRRQQRDLLLSAAWLNKMAVTLELKIIFIHVSSRNATPPLMIFSCLSPYE